MDSKTIAKKYNCEVFRDFGFDDKRKIWVAIGNDKTGFGYADGWTLKELKESIDKQLKL